MAAANFDIETYDIRMARQLDMQVDGNPVSYHACITCRGSGYTLILYFLDETSVVPNNGYNPDQKKGSSYLPHWQFQWYVDLLRNEKPIHCFLNSSTPNQNAIYTSAEPVGESEP